MNWKSIRLELGTTSDFPSGSVSRAYLVRLPLDDHDSLDEEALMGNPARATVRRHWSTEPDERGFVQRSNGHLAMRCNGKERKLHLNSSPIRLGGEVSIIEADGKVLPFRIASVR